MPRHDDWAREGRLLLGVGPLLMLVIVSLALVCVARPGELKQSLFHQAPRVPVSV